MKTLTIKLTAPLQSYGNEASFARRTTNDYPTKSAVVGMVAAALGYRRNDQRILTLNQLSFAVRIDQVGRQLTDFQTVEWKKDTRKITYRDYLQDAVFVVALGHEDDAVIDNIKFALKHPRFQLFLGRRSNAPAGVLEMQEFADQAPVAVLQDLKWQAASWYQRRQQESSLEIIADAGLLADKSSALVKDRVISFNQRDRQHGFRAIARTTVPLNQLDAQSSDLDTQHDPFTALGEE
ncbi:type I-E CRISPR-associated protein Cas5/CasD [Levilactobacillus suantsaiihabitans]|uniref:Type I-E CRISPR-associated protein Cas5/CasD n=1 Tax=Levilactobacillus suantsaiihabitans TaxID=2487722 RepID=A0A4Z0J685_9LACO|nr:type I-E CRISPR-associated protein Cas5/CasD [Levilactobacillus suantsaiihabitans]TGD17582.1 type I-E CRISPR-associated protein Cas5/CasD [Levilactobacillus suantsaiihabitans]